jgi:hypothetical protein
LTRSRIRERVKPLIPKPLLDVRRRLIAARQRREYGSLSAEEAFERIYLEGTWGQKFDSGAGSADAITGSYVRLVRSFIDEHEIRSVVDLGCGDFRVGRQLVSADVDYVGVDLVRPLVERNQRLYGSPKVRFEHANLVEDELPRGELALLRQVLQHLSNDEIERVLERTRQFRFLLVTEHLPTHPQAVPNIDKPHGPDVRVYHRSGVFLEAPPFSLDVETLLEVPVEPGSVLRTDWVKHPRH